MAMLHAVGEKEKFADTAWLGRYRVSASRGKSLDEALKTMGEQIEGKAIQHWIVNRAVLIKLVREALGDEAPINELISSAINWRARVGMLCGMICESASGKPLWVFHHVNRTRWVEESTQKAIAMLTKNRVVAVRHLETVLFGARSYNTWSASSFIFSRIVRQGRAEYVGADEFAIPRF